MTNTPLTEESIGYYILADHQEGDTLDKKAIPLIDIQSAKRGLKR